MKLNPRKHAILRQQLVHLAAGELGPLAGWRLRRQIARDPMLAREWEEVRQVWGGLNALRTAVDPLHRPAWPAPAVSPPAPTTLRGRPRRAVLAVGLAALFTVTGALAARFWHNWEASITFADAHGQVWRLSGDFQGKTQILDETGRPPISLGAEGWDTDEGNPNGVRVVEVAGVRREFRGPGDYELRGHGGRLLGHVRLSTISEEDQRRLDRERELETLHWERLYHGEADTATGRSNPVSLPGLVAGHDRHVSWVVVGYARVTATYLGGGKPIRETVVSGSPKAIPVESIAPRYRPSLERMLSVIPPPNAPPRIRWTIPEGPLVVEADVLGSDGEPVAARNDRWSHVRKRGVATGYGRHEVRDERGRRLLLLEVAPIGP